MYEAKNIKRRNNYNNRIIQTPGQHADGTKQGMRSTPKIKTNALISSTIRRKMKDHH
jgi:hypothetical protein